MKSKKIVMIIVTLLLVTSLSLVIAQDEWKDLLPCKDGETKICGSNVGACKSGIRHCSGGSWRPCNDEVPPTIEICTNGIDDDCNGIIDDCFDMVPYMLIILAIVLMIGIWILLRVT